MLNEEIMEYSGIFIHDLKINKKKFRFAQFKSVLLGEEMGTHPYDCRIRPSYTLAHYRTLLHLRTVKSEIWNL